MQPLRLDQSYVSSLPGRTLRLALEKDHHRVIMSISLEVEKETHMYIFLCEQILTTGGISRRNEADRGTPGLAAAEEGGILTPLSHISRQNLQGCGLDWTQKRSKGEDQKAQDYI